MNNQQETELNFTIDLAKQAGEILLNFYGGKFKQRIKSHAKDIVTEADEKAEELILRALREEFPQDDIIAEESGRIGSGRAQHTWLVDPLDGTYNFARGNIHFGVMIARANRRKVELSVVWCPLLNILAAAVDGGGTTVNGKRVEIERVTKPEALEKVLDLANPGSGSEAFKKLRNLFDNEGITASYWSAAARTVRTLQGVTDIHVSTPPGKIWDHTPQSLLLEEAGMKLTNLSGTEYIWRRDVDGFVAALPELHELIVSKMLNR